MTLLQIGSKTRVKTKENMASTNFRFLNFFQEFKKELRTEARANHWWIKELKSEFLEKVGDTKNGCHAPPGSGNILMFSSVILMN